MTVSPPKQERGRVKFYDAGRRFGFIVSDLGGEDIYLSHISVERAGLSTLDAGQRVSFTPKKHLKGDRVEARDVKLLEEEGAK